MHKIESVLVIGSGPIVIGQAAEFDYSGTQACMVLKEEGIRVILVNNNPATIMTDTTFADAVYLEPLNLEYLEKIIKKEKPQAVIAGMGGQMSLNLVKDMFEAGILEKYNVEIIGTDIEAIIKGEDRKEFKDAMEEINEPVIDSEIALTVEDSLIIAEEIGFPVIVRPAYTMGGSGGGIAKDDDELIKLVNTGLAYSPVSQVLIEKSIYGWKEIEYEMIRDCDGNTIVVCNMENIDPVGIHTGDSIVVAPSQTLSDKEYHMLRDSSKRIVDKLNIVGGCNVQFALEPNSFEYRIIEVNPRVSRSSALASKATGYPIAKVATKIALGYKLDEIINDITEKTYACFEPSLDYVAVKIPKWPFDKFDYGDRRLGTSMMATGEVMSLGNNFENAFLKAVRSLELGFYDLEFDKAKELTTDALAELITEPCDERIFYLAELLRRGVTVDELNQKTKVDKYFLSKFKNIVEHEEEVKGMKLEDLSAEELRKFKKYGLSDKAIAKRCAVSPKEVYQKRLDMNILPTYKMVDTCGGEFSATSNYYYSTYNTENESERSDKKKVVVLGSGPIRIGQGVEFDYCTVHGVMTLKEMGYEAIIVNNNPETVSTDSNISDKLYFEPITEEDVLNIIAREKPEGVIVQFGGQTSIKLSKFLEEIGVKILGTGFESIDVAEDREKFDKFLESLSVNRPKGYGVTRVEDGKDYAAKIGYPVLIRPSYVIGGMGMEIVEDEKALVKYLINSFKKDKKHPILIDRFLDGMEIEVDALSDGEEILIPGIMEHLEKAGVHSGDSVSIYPARLSGEVKQKIYDITKKIAINIKTIGLINIQFIYFEDEIYVIEVNPRASRTIPFISKITGVPMIDVATKLILGMKLDELKFGTGLFPEQDVYAIKVPVFSMEKLKEIDTAPGPEMKSTGEIMSIESTVEKALFKGFISKGMKNNKNNKALISINNDVKDKYFESIIELKKLGYEFFATAGTKEYLHSKGVDSILACKISEGDNNVLSLIDNAEIDMVINVPSRGKDQLRDGFKIRREAVINKVDCIMDQETLKAIIGIKKSKIDEMELDIFNICDFSIK